MGQVIKNWCPGSCSPGAVDAISPGHEGKVEAGIGRSGYIDSRIANEQTIARNGTHVGQGQRGSCRIGLAWQIGPGPDDGGEMAGKAKIMKDFLAKKLRLVGTDRQRNPGSRQSVKRVGHSWKGEIGWRGDHGMAGPELCDLLFRIPAMWSHDGGNHGFPANGIHGAGSRCIGRECDTAISQHGIDDGARYPHTVHQGAIEIEDNVAKGLADRTRQVHRACLHGEFGPVKN